MAQLAPQVRSDIAERLRAQPPARRMRPRAVDAAATLSGVAASGRVSRRHREYARARCVLNSGVEPMRWNDIQAEQRKNGPRNSDGHDVKTVTEDQRKLCF